MPLYGGHAVSLKNHSIDLHLLKHQFGKTDVACENNLLTLPYPEETGGGENIL